LRPRSIPSGPLPNLLFQYSAIICLLLKSITRDALCHVMFV
jgi:hypothetical protein